MKRARPTTAPVPVLVLDIKLAIEALLWEDWFTDLPALLAWHSTCQDARQRYLTKPHAVYDKAMMDKREFQIKVAGPRRPRHAESGLTLTRLSLAVEVGRSMQWIDRNLDSVFALWVRRELDTAMPHGDMYRIPLDGLEKMQSGRVITERTIWTLRACRHIVRWRYGWELGIIEVSWSSALENATAAKFKSNSIKAFALTVFNKR